MRSLIIHVILIQLFGQAISQYEHGWTIPLSKASSIIKIVKPDNGNKHILVGFLNGQLQVVQAHSKMTLKSIQLLDYPVTYVQVDHQYGLIFASGGKNLIILNREYTAIKNMTFQDNIAHLSLTKSQQGACLVNIQVGSKIISYQYLQNGHLDQVSTWQEFQNLEVIEFNPNHHYFYSLNSQNKFVSQKITSQYKKTPYLQRNFSFKINQLLTDHSSLGLNDDQLLVITEDGTIFYTRTGNIVTYIPYSTVESEYFIAATYCQNLYLSIVHERRYKNSKSEFFLTLIRRNDLYSHKVVLLDNIFGPIRGIKKIDCNHNLLILLSADDLVYVLESFKMFNLSDYVFQISIGALLVTIVAIFLYKFNKTNTTLAKNLTIIIKDKGNCNNQSTQQEKVKQNYNMKRLKKSKKD